MTVILWGICLGLLSLPLWYITASPVGGAAGPTTIPLAIAVVGGLAGIVAAPVAASVSQGLMALHRAVVAGLLCDSEQRELQRRVETLEVSRKAVIDVEATELRRIERDLHDGAQQRLVMLSIDLGLAAERIDTDPAGGPCARRRGAGPGTPGPRRAARPRSRDRAGDPARPRPGPGPERARWPAAPVPTVVTSTLPEGIRLPDCGGASGLLRGGRGAGQRREARLRHPVRGPLSRARPEGLAVEVWDDGVRGRADRPGRRARRAGRDGSRRSTARSPWRARPAGRRSFGRRSRCEAPRHRRSAVVAVPGA